jgi:lactoylglutathione lyase
VANVSLKLLVLKTHDVTSLCRFYQTLGLSFTEERHGSGPIHFSAPLGDAVMEIYPLPADHSVDASTRLGFAIPDSDVAVAAVAELGARIVKPPRETPWGYMAVVVDPDGRSIELYRM